MANDLNKCMFIGRLGKDPDVKFTPSGSAVANISLACGWKSKDKEGTEWVRIVAFGKLAEIMQKYLKKGSKIYVDGSLRTRKWEKDGQTHYSTEIVADQMQMLDGRGDSPSGGGYDRGADQSHSPAPSQSAGGGYAPPADDFDDDVPF